MVLILKMLIKMHQKQLFFVLFLLIFTRGFTQSIEQKRYNLDEINSVYIFFEGGFNNSLIKVKVNDSLIFCEKITTNSLTELAKSFSIDSKFFMQKVEVSVDGGNFRKIKYKGRKFIAINYFKGRLFFRHTNEPPVYD